MSCPSPRGSAWVLVGLFCALVLCAWHSAIAQQEPGEGATQKTSKSDRVDEFQRLSKEFVELDAQGKSKEAVAVAERLLPIAREQQGAESEAVLNLLDRVAQLYEGLEDFPKALKLRGEIYQTQLKLHGQTHWQTNDARMLVARDEKLARFSPEQMQQYRLTRRLGDQYHQHQSKGEFMEALATVEQEVAIHRALKLEDNPDYAIALANLALVAEALGDLNRAKTNLQKCLDALGSSLGKDHPIYASALDNWAQLLKAQGDLAGARKANHQALAIRKDVYGASSYEYATSLNNLGSLDWEQGDLVQARAVFEKALEVFRTLKGAESSEVAVCLFNLGAVLLNQNDLEGSRRLQEQALAITKKAQGELHPQYADRLNNLGMTLYRLGDAAAGRRLFEQALDIRKKVQGQRSPAYITGLSNLGMVIKSQGDLPGARKLLEQALALSEEVEGPKSLGAARNHYNLAALLLEQDNRDAGKLHLQKASQLFEELLGRESDNFALTLSQRAYVSWIENDSAASLESLKQNLSILTGLLYRALPALSEREQRSLLGRALPSLSELMALSVNSADRDRDTYEHVIALKGLTSESALARRAASVPQAVELQAKINVLRSNLNQLYQMSVPPEQAGARDKAIRQTADQLNQGEVELARAVGWKPKQPTVQALANALPPGATLIDFVVYDRNAMRRIVTDAGVPELHYAAFIVRPDSSVQRVELGPAQQVDQVVSRLRTQLEQRDGEPTQPAQELAHLVWEPVAKQIGQTQMILIAPDGDLNFVPWAALPGKAQGSYLIEQYAFGVIGSARQWLALANSPPPAGQAERLLAVGGVDYAEADTGPPDADETYQTRAAAIRGSTPVFSPLPGTKVEAETVVSLYRQTGHDGAELVTGGRATRDYLRAVLPRYAFLHLATHGYFARPEMQASLTSSASRRDTAMYEAMGRQEAAGWYPGLLSGLVWAGAASPPNDAATGQANPSAGIMTAEEVTGLDLSHCQLAVLSACETGLGRTAGGEGVLGLQRAFHQAGARTVIASLWKVEDDATQQLMTEFYANLWQRKLSVLESLRQAQLSLLRNGVGPSHRRGLEAVDQQSGVPPRKTTSPRLWGAWVLSGELGGSNQSAPGASH